jgi:hypothetical protein
MGTFNLVVTKGHPSLPPRGQQRERTSDSATPVLGSGRPARYRTRATGLQTHARDILAGRAHTDSPADWQRRSEDHRIVREPCGTAFPSRPRRCEWKDPTSGSSSSQVGTSRCLLVGKGSRWWPPGSAGRGLAHSGVSARLASSPLGEFRLLRLESTLHASRM